ncbi:MAG TPA: DUF1631 family protein [Aquabacterium sp.]|uniref:DUF1631 family protein n=1 Tax=Aquabacterium sp. TaxID=1872578 RepID=UPI002E362058|nr:DUF1631 family protein [Aquabacterium sp.]HEX5355708.1 DUF1631 family protein [Aquabacterium sp.]
MTDPRFDLVIDRAISRVNTAVSDAVDKVATQLGPLTLSATSNLQRQVLMSAERDLQLKSHQLRSAFGKRFRQQVDKIAGSARAQHSGHQVLATETDWASLSLVDNAEVERGVTADRLAQALTHECDAELESLAAYMTALMNDPNPERNPLRPQEVARALLEAIADLNSADDVVQVLAQHLGRVLGPELATCYGQIVADLRSQGVTPRGLTVNRTRSTTSVHGGMSPTNPGSLSGELPQPTQPGTFPDSMGGRVTSGYQNTAPLNAETHMRAAQALSEMFGVSMPMPMADGATPMGLRGAAPRQPGALPAVSPDFQNLLRQIAAQSPPPGWTADFPGGLPAEGGAAAYGMAPGEAGAGFAGPLMAVNLIRAHREELVKASGGAALDQMVIDIVAALFDQVLSDPKVSPQMARQIARLQMPVLRVALADMSFFNSRKHPVRRFVNRIATLSASFDDYDSGPGQACLERITALVNDIVDGDFDRMDTYESKLAELETFIDGENAREAAENAAVAAMLNGKEADLRVHQRYMQILKRELADVEMPDFLRDFLSQIWSQVQVMAAARDGAQSPLAARMKAAGHNLALSVQPKGHPQLRKEFLLKLPQLMKDLNEGLALIQWAEEAKQAFFAQLLPAHAECLKTAPQHDLTQRLLEHQLTKVEQIAIPSREEAANDPLPEALNDIKAPPVLTVVPALSPTEIKEAGFLPEAAVVAEGPLDIDLNLPGDNDPSLTEIDINLDAPAPPSAGLQLVHHIQKGAAYQMMMQGQWKKVRLTWVSDGRTFFIFNHGHTHKQTISLTARTLAKMCDSGRFKAFEQAELIERATVRARRQLAALSGGGSGHSAPARARSAA